MENHEKKILIAGFGGQGIVLFGNIIARAAVIEDKHVVGMVSYGAEMRGGTANATVIVSDELIFNPVVTRPNIAVVLNNPSMDRFEPQVTEGGWMLVNTSMTNRKPKRTDLNVIEVNASKIANEIGNLKVGNIVALGALIEHIHLLTLDSIEQGVRDLFSSKNPKLTEINMKALRAGARQSRLLQPTHSPVNTPVNSDLYP